MARGLFGLDVLLLFWYTMLLASRYCGCWDAGAGCGGLVDWPFDGDLVVCFGLV